MVISEKLAFPSEKIIDASPEALETGVGMGVESWVCARLPPLLLLGGSQVYGRLAVTGDRMLDP